MNPLDLAVMLRKVIKQEWAVDVRVVVEVGDEEAWNHLLEAKQIADRGEFALIELADTSEVVIDGVAFRLVRTERSKPWSRANPV